MDGAGEGAAAADDLSDAALFPDAGPERTCIVTRAKGPPDGFVRFVVGPDRAVVPDVRCRLPGRGAWVAAERAAVAEAVRRRAFKRALKAEVDADPALADLVAELLERDALQAFSMANKAGLVVAGAAKVEGSLLPRAPAALVHASDGSADGIRKLEAAARRLLGEGAGGVARVREFRSSQLDLALGRTNVIHAAVAEGSAAHAFVARARRLARYRGTPTAGAAEPEPAVDTGSTQGTARNTSPGIGLGSRIESGTDTAPRTNN